MTRMHRHDEQGASLLLVMIVSFVLMILATTLLQSALNGFRGAVRDERWQAALAAADAGVQDYLYRLNQDGNYWRWTNDTPPPEGNDALTGQAPVPGAANPATFSYEPDTSELATQGVVRLRSTGTVGGESRTVDVTLRRRSFLDYLYFTDLETTDPEQYPSSSRDWAQENCTQYAWADPSRSSSCSEIDFYQGGGFTDRINGPLHTNDRMRVRGSVEFNGETSSSYPLSTDADGTTACPPGRYLDTGGGDPVFANGCDPAYAPILQLPPNNQQIRREADAALGGTGCLFTGPTSIELSGTRMRVTSPFTKDSNCVADGTWRSLPTNGVVYVQDVPADSSDPNWTNGCPGGHPFRTELSSGDLTASGYGCRDGDAFVWGELDGQLTIAATNDVDIVWDLTVADLDGDDIIGLVADNRVAIYHPLTRSGGRYGYTVENAPPQFHDRRNRQPWEQVAVQAAILSVRHSFTVSYFQYGDPLGSLDITGAIAQKYRGPVGQFDSWSGRSTHGYEKNYVYDERLRYLTPPHFLDPVDAAWQVRTWAEASG